MLAELRARLAELHIDAEVHRPAEALLVDLREDGRAGQGVRRRPGPRRRPRRRRVGEGLLRRARLDPRAVAAGAGPVQGLHRDAQVQPLPVAAHDGGRARRASRSRCRSAPQEMHRRAEYGVAAHWGYKERDAGRGPRSGCSGWSTGSRRPTTRPSSWRALKIDLEQDEVFVFTPKGKVITLADRRHAGRLRVRDPHRGRAPLHRRPRQRPAGAARLRARSRATRVEIFTSKVEGAGPSRDWLQFVHTPRARTKIRQWFSRERRVDAIDTGRDELVKALRQRGPAGPEARAVADAARRSPSDAALRRPRRAPRRDRRGPRVGQGRRAAGPDGAARRRGAAAGHRRSARRGPARRRAAPTRRARRGPRRRDGAAVAVLHAGARRRDHGLRHPRPRRLGAPHRLRQRRRPRRARPSGSSRSSGTTTSPARYVVSVEVEALDRSRLLRDVADVLSEHHVNILSCTSQTSTDRVARFRFDFELADPGHLESMLAAVKRVDSRLRRVPGAPRRSAAASYAATAPGRPGVRGR